MSLHRYKIKIPPVAAVAQYANVSTWNFAGLFFCAVLWLLLPPVRALEADFTVLVMTTALISCPLTFILKLIAQHRYVVGVIISLLTGLLAIVFGLVFLLLLAQFAFKPSLLCASIYYSVLSMLSLSEYQRLKLIHR